MTPRRARDLEGRVAEMLLDRSLELPQGEDGLHQPGRATGWPQAISPPDGFTGQTGFSGSFSP